MILELLSAGLIISACLAIFLDEAVYSVAALAATFFLTSMLYAFTGALFIAVFQFAVGAGTLAVLFLSGEMLSEKTQQKTSLRNALTVLVAGAILSLFPIFISIPISRVPSSGVSFGEALWDLRAVDVVLQGLVIMTIAIGIAIVLYDKRNGES